MSRKEKQQPRLNLRVPQSLRDRFLQEIEFLNLETRSVTLAEDVQIKNRTEFIRWIINSYVHRSLDQGVPDRLEWDEDNASIPFFLDKQSRGLWETALRNGVADDYNQLASMALYDHFYRDQQMVATLATQFVQVKEWLKTVDRQHSDLVLP